MLNMPETQSKLLVIGAGLPRTGTLSLSYALETLFGGKCYHMKPFLEKGTDYDTKHWQDALEAYRRGESLPKERWVGLLEKRGFITAVDFPVSFYFEDLVKMFPEAKFVLSVRSPSTWHDSVKNSIMRVLKVLRGFPFSWINTLKGTAKKFDVAYAIGVAIPNGFEHSIFSSVASGPDKSAKFFNAWTEHVKAVIPPERLLTFEAREGWGPLCDFLGVPVPDTPYPRVNDSASFGASITKLERVSWFLTFAIPSAIAGLLYAYQTNLLRLF